MALYAPIALFLVPVAFMILIMLGFMAIYWPSPAVDDLSNWSGSSLLTLTALPMTPC